MRGKKIHFIINPRSAGGLTGRNWHELESSIRKHIGPFAYSFTDAPGSGVRLAGRALGERPDVLAVVGGDGTISEVVTGYMQSPGRLRPPIVVINQGTGGDFSRTLGVPTDLHLALDTIRHGRDVMVDVGKIAYEDARGEPRERHFINVAGCGMAGEVVRAVNSSTKRFGAFSYFLTSATKVFSYRNKHLEMQLDDGRVETARTVTLAICNGQFFGGGMQISPESEITDGSFEVVLIRDWGVLRSLISSRHLYSGRIASCPGVSVRKARRVMVRSAPGERPALIDCDGEDVGQTPLTVELLPGAVPFRI
ncbi:MAG: diacylglycerol kinase family lipid kinase [Spirochaetales bacterium]|nr:diacylglycerol kinase family lipid kinase [Leptospiraceae bacterium]MCP5483101.1 diacylglycerol kinase family lipid kinase [Spirochaetales bacterium]MCP5484541.1 diacylglycerol kinase family lipid kinase [Spirochaetales bacterium]